MAKEEKKRNTIERTWAYNLYVEDALETVALKGTLKTMEKIIESLQKDIDRIGQEVRMLWSKLEAHLGLAYTRLQHAERKAYDTWFEECKALAIQILLSTEVSLVQIPIPVISHILAILHIDRG